ncbi:MAG: prefoldin subunit alpha [Methanomassiliicoccaceae archaeon]|nr:prefoldin subunit alpha [Methanomassiliicoccaceae archaeon]
MTMDENELHQAMAVLDAYTAQLEALNRQVRLLQVSLEDTNRARDSFKALADAKEGDEILIPVGASSFIPAKVTGKKKAIVGIGNRLSTEKDLTEAAEFMEASGKDISNALREAIGALDEIERMANELSAAIENEYQNRRRSTQ